MNVMNVINVINVEMWKCENAINVAMKEHAGAGRYPA